MMSVATNLAKSGFFQDAREATQAFAKILAGAELGIPPFAAMSGIYIVKGKPQLGGVLLGGLVKRSGKYDYKVAELSDARCSIDFFQGTELIGNSTFTIEDAKKAGTQNTDKFPKNMLYARAMSNGVKWYTPDVTNGPVYAEGEFEEDAPRVQDTTAEVVHEAKPVSTGAELDPEVIRQMGIWTDNVDVLYNDETRRTNPSSWDVSFTALGSIANLPSTEKNKKFVALKNFAAEFNIGWDKDAKKFFVAMPVDEPETAETVEA
jgi:hypothetical protein